MRAACTRVAWTGVVMGLLAIVSVQCCAAIETSFDRYGVILERKPFGVEIVAPPSLPPVVPPAESVVNQIRMSAVIRDEDGTLRVGLVDLKSNHNYMLRIGETMDGIEVMEADYARERARLRRGPEDYWVSMFGGSNRFERVLESAVSVTASEPALSESVATAVEAPAVDQKLSYAKRRQQREEARLRFELERLRQQEEQKAKIAARGAARQTEGGMNPPTVIRAGKGRAGTNDVELALAAVFGETNKLELSNEEIVQLLQEYQKELIRSGQTPLPIPLTPETDKELVEEGLLPPQP